MDAATLFAAWAGFTALSQVLSGWALQQGVQPSPLLAVQALTGIVLQAVYVAWKAWKGRGRRERSSDTNVTTADRAAASPVSASSWLSRLRSEAIPLVSVAMINSMGMLFAHFATSILLPAQAQVLKNGEIAFAYAFSLSLGVSIGDNRQRVANASALVVVGAVLTAWQHVVNPRAREGAWVGVLWATVSSMCFGLRGVIFKVAGLKDVGADSPMIVLVQLTAVVLAVGISCWSSDAESSTGGCVAQLWAAGTNYLAVMSGAAWFSYTWASFLMLQFVSPVQHTILNNAKRAVVTLAIFAVFPATTRWSLVYALGVLLMLEGVAVLAGTSLLLLPGAVAAFAKGEGVAGVVAALGLQGQQQQKAATAQSSAPSAVAASAAPANGMEGDSASLSFRSPIPLLVGLSSSAGVIRWLLLCALVASAVLLDGVYSEVGGAQHRAHHLPVMPLHIEPSAALAPLSGELFQPAARLLSSKSPALACALPRASKAAKLSAWRESLAALDRSSRSNYSALLLWRCRAGWAHPPSKFQASDDRASLVFVASHVAWTGHSNIGDDIMPPLFAVIFARALAAEFPNLDVSNDIRMCHPAYNPRLLHPPYSMPKSFWVLGGGSVLEYLSVKGDVAVAAKTSFPRREPLYLLGPGFQSQQGLTDGKLRDDMLEALAWTGPEDTLDPAAAAAPAPATIIGEGAEREPRHLHNSANTAASAGAAAAAAPRLVWGGARGPLSRDIFNDVARARDALTVIGDPGFIASDLLLHAQHEFRPPTKRDIHALALPAKYIVSTCDYESFPSLTPTLRAFMELGYDVIALSIGNFSWRTELVRKTFTRLEAEFGRWSDRGDSTHPSLRTLSLHDLRSFPTLMHVLRSASLGLHCMLHGGILQASLGIPSLSRFDQMKALDAWLPTGLTTHLIHHAVSKQQDASQPHSEVMWRAKQMLAERDRDAAQLLAFSSAVRARHDVAMRAFVRFLTRERYPDVGSALACAPNGTRVSVRSFSYYEGAVLTVGVHE